jgi:hypothetical protein
MKKFSFIFVILFLSINCVAQYTPTPNIGMQIPNNGSSNWNLPLNYNFNRLDQLLSGNLPIPSLAVSGNITVVGSVQANQFIGPGGSSLATAAIANQYSAVYYSTSPSGTALAGITPITGILLYRTSGPPIAALYSDVSSLWTGTGCSTTTNVPQLNGNCTAAGGGGGGATINSTPQNFGFIQPNSGSASNIAGPATTTTNAQYPVINSETNTDDFVSGGGNNGLANAVTAGQGFLKFPWNSISTESSNYIGQNVPGAPVAKTAGVVFDYRGGIDETWLYNSFNQTNCKQTVQSTLNGNEADVCTFQQSVSASTGNPEGNGFITNIVHLGGIMYDYTPGIQDYNTGYIYGYHDGDVNNYLYEYFGGNNRDHSAEANQIYPWKQQQFPNVFNSQVTVFTDQRHIMTSLGSTAYGQLYGGGWMYNPLVFSDATTFTGYSTDTTKLIGAQTFITSTTHTPATIYGTVTSNPVPVTSNSITGTSATTTITLGSGSAPYTSGSPICISGSSSAGSLEEVVLTAVGTATTTQTITGLFRYTHPVNAVAVGGHCEAVRDWADLQTNPGGTNNITSFSIDSSNNVTVNTSGFEVYPIGTILKMTGMTTGTYLNSIYFQVSSSTGTTVTMANPFFTHSSVSTTSDTGVVFPNYAVSDVLMPILPGGPDSTHYWAGFPVLNDTGFKMKVDTNYSVVSAVRNGSGSLTLTLPAVNGYANMSLNGTNWLSLSSCSDATMDFSSAQVTSTSFSYPNTVVIPQSGSSSTATSCILTRGNLNQVTIHNIAEVQSVGDPAVAPNSGNVDGYFYLGPNALTLTVGTPVAQPGGAPLAVNNTHSIQVTTPNSPVYQSSAEILQFSGEGTTGPGFVPFSIIQNDSYSNFAGFGGLWIPGTAMKIQGNFATEIEFVNGMNFGGTGIKFDLPSTNTIPYAGLQFTGSGNSNYLMFNPANYELYTTQAFGAPSLLSSTLDGTTLGGINLLGSGNILMNSQANVSNFLYWKTNSAWSEIQMGVYGPSVGICPRTNMFLLTTNIGGSINWCTDNTGTIFEDVSVADLSGNGTQFVNVDNNGHLIYAPQAPLFGITGRVPLSSGTATVTTSNALLTSTARIHLTNCSPSGTSVGTLAVASITPTTSFTINSLTTTNTLNTADNSTVCYQLTD